MSGFSRPTDRHAKSIQQALREGHYKNRGANVEVFFNGACEVVTSFDGFRYLATGCMDFWHHSVRVLAVDFTNDRITDFGYDGYSHCTTQNIQSWMWMLRSMNFINTRSLESCVYPTHWTWMERRTHRTRKPMHSVDKASDRVRWTYRTTAPWVRQDLRIPWFHGKLYNAGAVLRSRPVMDSILDRGQWHWFTGAWVNGEWTRCFIDAETEKRYNRRRRTAA